MGEQADLLNVLQIDEAKTTYQELRQELDRHFSDRKNVIVERAKFNQRKQKPGEPIDNFIQDLHKLGAECEFGKLKEELIRDRIVVGVLNDSLSEELQAKPKLTLAMAIQLSRQAEARLESQPLLRDRPAVNAVNQQVYTKQKLQGHKDPSTFFQAAKRFSAQGQQMKRKCYYCGQEPHSRNECPAKNAICAVCQKRGYFKAVCRSRGRKSIHEVSDEMDGMTDYFSECNFQTESQED